MGNIEILGYFPNRKMPEFLDFCVNGAPAEPGATGVFEWLYGRLVLEAHFFISGANDPIQMFAATLKRHPSEPGVVPWMDRIVGLKKRLHLEGVVGDVSAFPPLNQPLAKVIHNQAMDDLFEQGKHRIERVFEALSAENKSGFSFTAEQFQAALGGDLNVDRKNILAEIEDQFGTLLFGKPDLEKILESVR